MKLIKTVGKVILAFVLIVLLAAVIKYADTIRAYISSQPIRSVEGAKISLEKEIKNEIDGYAENVTETVLNIKISDILKSVSRIRKIGSDMEKVKEYIAEEGSKIMDNGK